MKRTENKFPSKKNSIERKKVSAVAQNCVTAVTRLIRYGKNVGRAL